MKPTEDWMKRHHTTRWHVYAATVVDTAARAKAAMSMWNALCEAQPALIELQPNGVHVADLEADVTVRWAGQIDQGAFACEVIDLPRGEWWQSFVAPVGPTELRAGWSRRGDSDTTPDVWTEFALGLQLSDHVEPVHEPEFATLVAAMWAGAQPLVHVEDVERRRALSAELEHWRTVAARQSTELRVLRHSVARPPEAAHQIQVERLPPTSPSASPEGHRLDDLQAWADANADRIVVLPRAIAEAKRALYEDQGRAYAVLEMLAETYRMVKLGLLPRERLKQHADELGVLIGGSTDAGRARGFGDEYFVSYGGRRRFLDQHVGRGVSRDPRYSLRVYYTWCDDTKRVVVGWLPTHLSIRSS